MHLNTEVHLLTTFHISKKSGSSLDEIMLVSPSMAEAGDFSCAKNLLHFVAQSTVFARRFTLSSVIPQESSATDQTGFRGHSSPLCTPASKAPLITNSALENRLEHLNKADLKAVGQRILTEGTV